MSDLLYREDLDRIAECGLMIADLKKLESEIRIPNSAIGTLAPRPGGCHPDAPVFLNFDFLGATARAPCWACNSPVVALAADFAAEAPPIAFHPGCHAGPRRVRLRYRRGAGAVDVLCFDCGGIMGRIPILTRAEGRPR
ncbi:MAG TPA: hypothetical protein VG406_26525 [Isosphaeraceae bacterium]|jgi:hypothetical protein|nr:hypothetical protein [Isosphaeraceae bacterium]